MADEKEKQRKHALNNPKIILTAVCPTANTKVSQMKWSTYLNNPQMEVRTNDPSLMNKENGYGQIRVGMDAPIFWAFLEMIKMAIDSPIEWKNRIKNDDYNCDHLSDIWVGKDKDGCVYISLISKKEDKPVIKFIFGAAHLPNNVTNSRFHYLFHADGTPYTKAEESVIYAKSYYRLLDTIMGNVLVHEYVEPPPYVPKGEFNKGGGGGGYNNNQRKPYVQPNSSDDTIGDGLPF
jgi:hypothetical protein